VAQIANLRMGATSLRKARAACSRFSHFALRRAGCPRSKCAPLTQLSWWWWLRIVVLRTRFGNQFLDCPDARQHGRRLNRHEDNFRIVALRHVAEALDVARRDQVLRWVSMLMHSFGNQRNCLSFALGISLSRFCSAFGCQYR